MTNEHKPSYASTPLGSSLPVIWMPPPVNVQLHIKNEALQIVSQNNINDIRLICTYKRNSTATLFSVENTWSIV